MACFADINVSQGSVATYARCDGRWDFWYPFNCKFTKESCSEKILKSLKNWQNYDRKSVAPFLAHPVYYLVFFQSTSYPSEGHHQFFWQIQWRHEGTRRRHPSLHFACTSDSAFHQNHLTVNIGCNSKSFESGHAILLMHTLVHWMKYRLRPAGYCTVVTGGPSHLQPHVTVKRHGRGVFWDMRTHRLTYRVQTRTLIAVFRTAMNEVIKW